MILINPTNRPEPQFSRHGCNLNPRCLQPQSLQSPTTASLDRVYVPSVLKFLRFLANLRPQRIAGHERAIKPEIDLDSHVLFWAWRANRHHMVESETIWRLCDEAIKRTALHPLQAPAAPASEACPAPIASPDAIRGNAADRRPGSSRARSGGRCRRIRSRSSRARR